jgi:hypothetical protein
LSHRLWHWPLFHYLVGSQLTYLPLQSDWTPTTGKGKIYTHTHDIARTAFKPTLLLLLIYPLSALIYDLLSATARVDK